MLTTLLTSVGAYIGTALDDLFILTLLFSQTEDISHRKSILQGQVLGVGILVAVSLLGAAGLQLLPPWAIGLTGLIPLALGARELFRRAKHEEGASSPLSASLLRVALLAIANGADNVGIYAPLFAGYDLQQKLLSILLFAAMTVIWCALAALLSSQPVLHNVLLKYKRTLVPVVLIALGIYILASGFLPIPA